MIRNLKALGLSLVAVLAMSAMAASAAQAEPVTITPENGQHAILDGEQVAGESHVFTSSGRTVTCTGAIFHGTINGNTSTATIEPTYSGCHANLLGSNLPATVTMNGCDYEFHGTEMAGANLWRAHVDLLCPPGKKIEVHVYSNHPNHTAGTSACTLTIPEKKNLTTVDFENMDAAEGTPDDITVRATVTGIKTEVHGSALLCGSSNETSTYSGNTTVKATNTEGKFIKLTVSGGTNT